MTVRVSRGSIAGVAVIPARIIRLAVCALAAGAPPARGGGGELGGRLAGLSLTVQNNGADPLTLSSDGAFTFAGSLAGWRARAATT